MATSTEKRRKPSDLCLRPITDGTVIWTAPTGRTYTTHPGSQHLFPQLCGPPAVLWAGEPPVADTRAGRGAMMPKRRHTRVHAAAKDIAAERILNDAHVAERNKPPPF